MLIRSDLSQSIRSKYLMFCVNCGTVINEDHDFCSKCGTKKNESKQTIEIPVELKSVPLTIILSIILEGLGHIYIEQTKKGVIFVGIGLALWIISFLDLFTLVVAIPFWAWVLYDSYKNVKLYNKFVGENGKKPEW